MIDKSQERPSAIVQPDFPSIFAPGGFRAPTITAPTHNQHDYANIPDFAGADTMENVLDLPPPTQPTHRRRMKPMEEDKHSIFLDNELLSHDESPLFFDVMGAPKKTPYSVTATREKFTTQRDYNTEIDRQTKNFEEEHQKDSPDIKNLKDIDRNSRYLEFKKNGGYQNMRPTQKQQEERTRYITDLSSLIQSLTNYNNLDYYGKQGYDVSSFMDVTMEGMGSNLVDTSAYARISAGQKMRDTQTQIDSKIENLLELYPDLYINYADFDTQIKDISNNNFEDMWDDMYWVENPSSNQKTLAFTHTPTKAERLAVKLDAGINKISHSYN